MFMMPTIAICLAVINTLLILCLVVVVGAHGRIIRRLAGMPTPEEKMREWGWTRRE